MEVVNCVFMFTFISLSTADTFTVKIGVENHVNVVDRRFLSFTIDPKYLFSSVEKYKSKECICMASSLTPAYIRIAGPSTSSMTFQNATIAINELEDERYQERKTPGRLAVSHRKWRKFVQWAKSTGFDLVFALNNEEKTSSGMWDPNTALNILTFAEKANIDDIFWQLGYECNHQSIEEYLNDMETLRVIIETFAPGRAGVWRVVGGDVSNCLHADSKSDFKDYVMLSNDMMDAIMLNGNSSSHELLRMSEADRVKLLKRLSQSTTPLWLTESPRSGDDEVERAADWLSSLGYSAKNGFSVHFRELLEEEMYEPTLSFYMALLFKNLVGERVLEVELDSEQSVLFAHCTSLRHKAVPGAVTIYGANMDDEVARFSIKMSKREEGGDIMQFVIGQDHNGNIVVNGRPMYHEGDIKPVVKRVRPYKTLLINLPPKSFGFWVLANTNVKACQYYEGNNDTSDTIESNYSEEESAEVIRTKRLVDIKRSQVEKVQKATEKYVTNINFLGSNVNNESELGESNNIKALKNNVLNNDTYNNVVKKCNETIANRNTNEKVGLETNMDTRRSTESSDGTKADVLDLDDVNQFEIVSEITNNLQEEIADMNSDLDVSRKDLKNNMKKKRDVEDDGTDKEDSDNVASSSVTNNSKTNRSDDGSKRRKPLTARKRLENTKSSKLRKSEQSKYNKLERLRAKLFKKEGPLEGRSSILDNILAKRNTRHKNDRRKLRLSKNKLSKRNLITSKKGIYRNNDMKEERTRFRRSVNEPINFNDTNIALRHVKSADVEDTANIQENTYKTNKNIDNTNGNIRITTSRSGRNVRDIKDRHEEIVNQNYNFNTYESELERSNEEVLDQDEVSKENKNTMRNKSIIHKNKITRSGRIANKGHIRNAEDLDNDITTDDINNTKLWKILRRINKQLNDLSTEDADYDTNINKSAIQDQNTSNEDSGLIKSTVNNLLKVLRELNKNLNRFWSGVNLLD